VSASTSSSTSSSAPISTPASPTEVAVYEWFYFTLTWFVPCPPSSSPN
jgi:hypothetical protein